MADTPDRNVPGVNSPAANASPANVPAATESTAHRNAADVQAQLVPLLVDLLYPSESDEPIDVVETGIPGSEPLTIERLRDGLKLSATVHIEEQSEADFWSPVITIENWFSEEEKASAKRFQQLKEAVEGLLTNRRIFRVGETEIDTYLLGKPVEGPLTGLKTLVVET